MHGGFVKAQKIIKGQGGGFGWHHTVSIMLSIKADHACSEHCNWPVAIEVLCMHGYTEVYLHIIMAIMGY